MSLLKDLQKITERTYGELLGINLEKFIVGKKRFRDLSIKSQSPTDDLSDLARVFYRIADNNLYLAIYFSRGLIQNLESHDPRRGLHEKNIEAFMVFNEEINHGIHLALKFGAGETALDSEPFIRDLELQAKIDTYQVLKFFLAYFNPSRQLERLDRIWLRYHLFERVLRSYRNARLGKRYREVNNLGEKYSRYLDYIRPEDRLGELRRFREMSYAVKRSYIRMLP